MLQRCALGATLVATAGCSGSAQDDFPDRHVTPEALPVAREWVSVVYGTFDCGRARRLSVGDGLSGLIVEDQCESERSDALRLGGVSWRMGAHACLTPASRWHIPIRRTATSTA